MHFKDFKETKRFLGAEISVVIPFFNAEKTLKRAIESVLSQSFSNWDLILINDGSKDTSDQVAKSFLGDSRISLFSVDNQGVSAARNLGGAQARGEWLLFLDADDQLRPGFLQTLSAEIAQAYLYDYLIFGINRIKGKEEEISLPVDGQYFSRIPGTFAIRKAIFDQVGGYDTRFRFAENTELFHRLEQIQAKGKNIPVVSLNYYDNPSGGSKNLKNMVASLSLFLDKHAETLSPHVKHLYHQIIGVNFIRFRNFSLARHHLFNAIKYKPTKMATWGRFGLACFPLLAKYFYLETVKYD